MNVEIVKYKPLQTFYHAISTIRIIKRKPFNNEIERVDLYAKAGEHYKVKEDSLLSKVFTAGTHIAKDDIYVYRTLYSNTCRIASDTRLYTKDGLLDCKGIIFVDGEPYCRSWVEVTFTGGEMKIVPYDTDEEAYDAAVKIAKEHNLKEWND